jgi:hypothetical protein
VILAPALASAQAPKAGPQQVDPAAPEIALDEATTLKAAALEARLQAVLANIALLQRQFQDFQQEGTKILEERKRLIEDAGKRGRVDVRDVMEWVFDSKGQRYVKGKRTP